MLLCVWLHSLVRRWYALTTRGGGRFNYLGFGNFFGQNGEIRISNVRRYGR